MNNPEQIIQPVLTYFGRTLEEMKSRSRKRELVECRHHCMYLLKKATNMTLLNIALYFNRLDHTTTIHAIECVENIEFDPICKKHYKFIQYVVAKVLNDRKSEYEFNLCQSVYLPTLSEMS